MKLREYGTETTITFPLVDPATGDYITSASFVAGDCTIIQNGGSFGNTTNLPSHVTKGIYALTLTASEMATKEVVISIVDQTATKVWRKDNGHIRSPPRS